MGSSLRNPISFLGIFIALLSTAFGLPLMFMDMLSRHTPPYLGVIIYLILPFVAGGGIIISLLGESSYHCWGFGGSVGGVNNGWMFLYSLCLGLTSIVAEIKWLS